jgi:hypothetical protein
MKVFGRGLVAMGGVGLMFGVFGPWISDQINELRVAHSAPLQTAMVRQKLSLLPADAQKSPAVLQLQTALVRDGQLGEYEQRWSRAVGVLLSEEDRQKGLLWADLNSPSPPPPQEAPGVDGDVSSLATILLETYGYQVVQPPEIPAQDPWVGVDRRRRTRVLVALVQHQALTPEKAHQILSVTLDLLQHQIERSENLETIKMLLPVAMGEG